MKPASIPTVLLCLLAATAVRAQHVGIAGDYRIGVLESGRRTDGWRSWCRCDDPGSALATGTLFTAAFLFADEISPIAAGASLGYGTALTRFVSPSYVAERPDLPTAAELQYRESVRSTTLRVDLEGAYRMGRSVSLTIGPWFEYLLQSTTDRFERIVAPPGTLFPGDVEQRVLGASEAVPVSLRWGAMLGVSLALPMSEAVQLVPRVVIESDLQGLGRARPGALMLGFGTAVVFDVRRLARDADAKIAAVPPSDAPTPDARTADARTAAAQTAAAQTADARTAAAQTTDSQIADAQTRNDRPVGALPTDRAGAGAPEPRDAAPTRATVSLFAIDGGKHLRTAVVRRETIYRRSVAQMPRQLPLRSTEHGVVTADSAGGVFATASLIGADPDAIDASALDILGLRMRDNPSSTLRLVASAPGGEGTVAAAHARAELTRAYLATRWGIERSRIGVATEATGASTIPTVRIDRASAVLTAPIVLEWLDERLTLPPLGVDPAVDAPRGVARVRLRLLRGGRTLAEGTIADAMKLGDVAVDLRDAVEGTTPAPIVAELEVVDSSGATTRAIDELSLALPPAAEATVEHGHDRERITIFFTDCDDRDCIDRAMLTELERAVTAGAHVQVRVPFGSGGPHASGGAMLKAARDLLRRRGAVVEEDVGVGTRVVVEIGGQ